MVTLIYGAYSAPLMQSTEYPPGQTERAISSPKAPER
jgi:hypothetical protein